MFEELIDKKSGKYRLVTNSLEDNIRIEYIVPENKILNCIITHSGLFFLCMDFNNGIDIIYFPDGFFTGLQESPVFRRG